MMLEFFIDCQPPTVTAQHKGVSIVHKKNASAFKGAKKFRPAFFKKPELEAAEAQYVSWFWPKRPPVPLEGPLRLDIVFIFPWRDADLKRRMAGKLECVMAKDTQPDTDNILKLPKDTLSGCRFWHNDGQVCAELVRKFWGDRTGIHVKISHYTTDYVPPMEDPL